MTGFLRFKRKEESAVASEIKRRFTDTEMQIVRETDLLELLTHLGYQVKRIGRYHTTAEMDSLRIKDRRTWFRYSQNTGGDAITLVQQFCDKTFPEAVEYLLTFNGRARDSPAKAVPSVKRDEVQKPFTLPPRNTDDRRVFAYLRKRGIAAQVIRQFMNSGLLYEDAEHHNCVFVGKNSAGQAKYAGLRGTYDRDGKGFRGDVTGSDKNVGFAIPHDPTSDQVRVFEAPIDLMSYLTLHREPINAIALCGLYDGALETYLKDHPSIKRITLCLDADAPGRAAAQQLKDKYSASGYAVTVEEPRSGKDWNEYLQKRNTPERGRYQNIELSPENVAKIMENLPADLSAERRQVVLTAYQLLGKVHYFWGGKSLIIGWDSRWGMPMKVTAEGSSTTGTVRPFGLDCSGMVDWVFYNQSGGQYVIGHGGGATAQHSYCAPIAWGDAQPGDLVFYPGDSHVGIVCGFDSSGNIMVIHCASSENNVVVTGKSGFTSIGRPEYFAD